MRNCKHNRIHLKHPWITVTHIFPHTLWPCKYLLMIHKRTFCWSNRAHLCMCSLQLFIINGLFSMQLGSKVLTLNWIMKDLIDDPIQSYLSKHLQWIKPNLNTLKLQPLVDFGDGNTLDINLSTVGLSCDLFPFASIQLVSSF